MIMVKSSIAQHLCNKVINVEWSSMHTILEQYIATQWTWWYKWLDHRKDLVTYGKLSKACRLWKHVGYGWMGTSSPLLMKSCWLRECWLMKRTWLRSGLDIPWVHIRVARYWQTYRWHLGHPHRGKLTRWFDNYIVRNGFTLKMTWCHLMQGYIGK